MISENKKLLHNINNVVIKDRYELAEKTSASSLHFIVIKLKYQ